MFALGLGGPMLSTFYMSEDPISLLVVTEKQASFKVI